MDDALNPSLKDLSSDALDERLKVFASVQYDPELWDLVQTKFHKFEDLHTQMEKQQLRRRDLLKELSEVNESISDLQDQLIVLSGKEKINQEIAEMDTQAKKVAADPVMAAPLEDEASPPPLVEESTDDEPVVGLAPIDEEEPVAVEAASAHLPVAHDTVVPWQSASADASLDESASAVAAQDSALEEPSAPVVADPEVEAAVENIEAYQPITDQPVEPEPVAPVVAEPVAQPEPAPEPLKEESIPAPAQPALEIPAEVHELQKLFDQADQAARQSDSALKLVQLYDGKAETFFAAMTRSHQQGGLAIPEAQQEATKDVQTMIATAKSSNSKSGDKKGGVKRLFGSK